MGVAEVAAQLAIRQKEGNQKAMDDLSNMVKMERFKKLGKQFMDIGDYSPQGIQRFAKGNGIGIDEMQGLIQLVGQFQKIQPDPTKSLISPVNPANFTPESLGNFSKSSNYSDLRTPDDPAKSLIGQVDPSKFTPDSLGNFSKSRNFADLRAPDETPKPETGPQFDEKYRGLIQSKELGNSLSPEDSAYIKAYEKQKTLAPEVYAKTRLEIAGINADTSVPGSTPTMRYNKITKEFKEGDRVLTPDEVKAQTVKFAVTKAEDIPVSDVRTMQQAVPSVLQLSKQTRRELETAINDVGPLAGRWSELWTGKIGAENTSFMKLKVDIGLLQTRLMKMHVGARGGAEILKHFDEIISAGKQSPANMKVALDSIEEYANEIGLPLSKQRESVGLAPSGNQNQGIKQNLPDRLPGETVADYMKRAGGQ